MLFYHLCVVYTYHMVVVYSLNDVICHVFICMHIFFLQIIPQASTMVDKLQESLQFYKEMSKTEEQTSPQKTGDSEKAKES